MDSGATVVASRGGVIGVDSSRIVVKVNDDEISSDSLVDIYNILKYTRSNQNTNISQNPIVKKGDKISKGDAYS